MKILITGHRGFIGKHLFNHLLDKDHIVAGLDLPNDICDKEDVNKSFDLFEPDIVVHLASNSYLEKTEDDIENTFKTNVIGTTNILKACFVHSVDIIFASSGAVYGDSEFLPVTEDEELKPTSIYGMTKLMAEEFVRFYGRKYGLEWIIFRLSSVYGDGREVGPVNKFLDILSNGSKRVIVNGDGYLTRDYTHVSDVVEAIEMMITKKIFWNDIYNLSCGTQTSLRELIEIISDVLGRAVDIEYHSKIGGNLQHSYFDISKIKKFGFTPKYGLKDGIQDLALHEYL